MNLMEEIRRTVRADNVVQSVVGFDQDREPKVYTTIVKTNVEPPYLFLTLMPVGAPINAYGDPSVWEEFQVQASNWGRTEKEAWALADVTDDAILQGQYSFDPYAVAGLRRASTPFAFPDSDTNAVQVVIDYTYQIGR